MKRDISIALLALALLTGCGGGGDKADDKDTIDTPDNPSITTSISDKGKTDGKYNLWDYMTPQNNGTNNFIETKGDKTNEYKTTYSISKNKVTEVSDYAQNEKTIYKKKKDRVTVEFLKDEKFNGSYEFNGSYDLHLTADIDGDVTILTSTCKLTNHFNSKIINDTKFLDIIEIRCNNKPGYYQKNIGEIAQTDIVDAKGTSSLRVLAN